jgi:AraC family transcriptional regulator, exoenzyme S synthesis regulatory protein ExsA
MTNVFEHIKDFQHYRKIAAEELLFVEFKCLVEDLRFGMWSQVNYFVFVTNGKKMWKTYKEEYVVEAGDALFVKKGANIAHQYHSEDYCALIIFIPDNFIKEFMVKYHESISKPNDSYLESDGVIPIDVDPFLNSYIKSLEGYFSMQGTPDRSMLKLKLEEFMMNIFSSKNHSKIANYFMQLEATVEVQLKQVMESNFAYNLRLEDYAKLCNMSLSTFKRCFSTIYKDSPAKWLNTQKIQLATHFLKSSDKSVNQIALDTGFEETSNFIKVFKKLKNVTPLNYRKSETLV